MRSVRNFTNEQLNEIPPGFNNNLIWNIGHMIASQQDLFYIHTGIGLRIDQDLYLKYKIGTRPAETVSDNEIDIIKSLALSTITQLNADFENGLFNGQPQLDGLLTHFFFHEGIHMAYIFSIRRLLIFSGNL